jgi:diguanylate cyclase (GGDEF)-like protein
LSAAQDAGGGFCLAIFDVDHFKNVNDRQGHLAGDKYLVGVAGLLAENVRDGDYVARIGGEAGKIIDRIRCEICQRSAAAAGLQGSIALSAGWSASEPGDNPEAIYHRADAALAQAKASGRNRTHPHGEGDAPDVI